MPDYFHLVPQVRTFVELEEQNKGNLNYYGQPVPTYDYSSFPVLKSDSRNNAHNAVPENAGSE